MDKIIKSSGIMPYTRAVLSSRSRIFSRNYRDTAGALEQVGAIQTFDVNSSRNIEPLRGIGLGDHIIEMVPGQTEPIELSITRFALSMANIFQEFGYPSGADGLVRALKHHRYPIDIKQEVLVSKLADKATITDFTTTTSQSVNDVPRATGGTAASAQDVGTNFEGFKFHDGLNDGTYGFIAVVTWYEGCWFSSYSTSHSVDQAAITEQATLMVTDVSGYKNGDIVLPFTPKAMVNASSKIWFNPPTTAPPTTT